MAENLHEYAEKRTLDELIADRQGEEQKILMLQREVDCAKRRLEFSQAHAEVFQGEIDKRLGIAGLRAKPCVSNE